MPVWNVVQKRKFFYRLYFTSRISSFVFQENKGANGTNYWNRMQIEFEEKVWLHRQCGRVLRRIISTRHYKTYSAAFFDVLISFSDESHRKTPHLVIAMNYERGGLQFLDNLSRSFRSYGVVLFLVISHFIANCYRCLVSFQRTGFGWRNFF